MSCWIAGCGIARRASSLEREMSAAEMTVRLNNGHRMPLAGLGTFHSAQGGDCREAVKQAILCGYRHIDGAAFYQNEKSIGEGIREAIKESEGKIRREDIFLTSKVWGNKMHPDDVESALRSTLRDLRLDYVDLYLIHWPHAFARGDDFYPMDKDGNVMFDETISPTMTWTAMEKMVEKGFAKNIGLSNFNSKQVQDILDMCKIKPVTNQVEFHPRLAQSKLRAFCADRDIVLTGYSPFGAPHGNWERPEKVKGMLEEPTLRDVAEKHGKSVPQVILRWMIQQGVATIPKSANPERIKSNIDIFDFRLDDEDFVKIASLDLGPEGRTLSTTIWFPTPEKLESKHKHYPFAIEF